MASSPMRKLRNTGARDADGNVVPSHACRPSRVHRSHLGWNRWSAAENVEHLLGMSLDRMHDYLSWPADGLSLLCLRIQNLGVRA
jgi:hypothetical protein